LLRTIKNTVFLACALAASLPPQNGSTFRSNAEIVVVPFTVVNSKATAVGDLTRDEFHVYIQTDLRHRYVLGFRPERLSGKVRHDLQVEVTGRDLTVRARQTYFEYQK
jgi:hypothetical protein